MREYTTAQGDMWDAIAHRELGDAHYKAALMKANPQYVDVYVFSGGCRLVLPEVDTLPEDDTVPPWKKVAG